MIKIDATLLQELGLSSLPDVEKDGLLKHIYETLEMRVGMRLADQMTNQQLDEFEQYFEAKDDAGAFKWLEANFPNYKDIVQEEFDKLKAEVAATVPQILAASQAQHAQMPQAEAPQPVQPVQPIQPQAVQPPVGPAGPYAPQPAPQPYQPAPQPMQPPQPPVDPSQQFPPTQPLS